jgi:hypothetical protein
VVHRAFIFDSQWKAGVGRPGSRLRKRRQKPEVCSW